MVSLHSHATRLGVLDIGSNTVHMLIVDAAPGARPEPEASAKSTVRLMQYLKEDGTIKKAGVEAVISAVEKAMELAKEYEITQLLVLATSALREAPNGGKILRRIEDAIGQPVTVLSGVDEARLTFLAARRWYGWDAGRLLVIDIGGGSLEVAMGSDEDPTVALSVPAGAGRITREFLPENGIASEKDLENARRNIRKILDPMVEAFPKSKHPMHAVGTSKTIRSLARLAGAVMRQPCRGHVDYDARPAGRLASATRGHFPRPACGAAGCNPERTYQIVGGGLVVDEIMKALDVKEIEICPWALREGAILRWLDQFGRTRLGF